VSTLVPPPKELDEDLVAQLAFEGASDRDIAAILGCDHTTIANRFSPILKKRRA
jgi:DNA-directed RNA polymerase specialized sigma24 family protein